MKKAPLAGAFFDGLFSPRGKESSHMRGVRSFDSVPTCSGCFFSHRAFLSARDDGAWGADSLTGRRHRCLFRRGYSRIDDLIPSHQSLATSRQSRQRQDAIFPTLLDGRFLFML